MSLHKKLPLRVKSVEVQAYWSLDLKDQMCGLCHKHLMNATQEEIDNRNVMNTVMVSKCNHGLHKDCYKAWEKAGNKFCPIDHSNWEEADTADVTVVWTRLDS